MVAGQLHAGAFRYQSATDHLPVTELSGRFTFVPVNLATFCTHSERF